MYLFYMCMTCTCRILCVLQENRPKNSSFNWRLTTERPWLDPCPSLDTWKQTRCCHRFSFGLPFEVARGDRGYVLEGSLQKSLAKDVNVNVKMSPHLKSSYLFFLSSIDTSTCLCEVPNSRKMEAPPPVAPKTFQHISDITDSTQEQHSSSLVHLWPLVQGRVTRIPNRFTPRNSRRPKSLWEESKTELLFWRFCSSSTLSPMEYPKLLGSSPNPTFVQGCHRDAATRIGVCQQSTIKIKAWSQKQSNTYR